MSARLTMTMRVTLKRNAQQGQDPYGQPGPPKPEIVGIFPCRAWSGSGRLVVTAERMFSLEGPAMIVPLDVDVRVGDQVVQVVDRRDRQVFGPMGVDAVMRRKDHLAAILRKIDA